MEWYGMVWNSPWNHMEQSMEQSMDSIWNGTLCEIFTKSNLDSMFIPWTVFHGFHALCSMDSTWNPYGTNLGLVKNQFKKYVYCIY
jgi:hypothetical protein